MPLYDYDDRTNTRQQVWHNDRNFAEVITHLIETMQPSCFVETGTHMGWTSAWIAQRFPWLPVFTSEVDPEYFYRASHNLMEFPSVAAHLLPSVEFLKKLCPMLARGNPLFWLDAHWMPPEPLLDECRVVAQLPKYVALIDDFHCKDPTFHGDTFNYGRDPVCLEYVAGSMGPSCWRPDYPAQPGNAGYGMFIKNVPYTPPRHMKREQLP